MAAENTAYFQSKYRSNRQPVEISEKDFMEKVRFVVTN